MSTGNKNLGRKMKDFRLDKGMTQKQAAAFFGIGYVTYMRIESGKSCRDLTRVKITKVLEQVLQAA
jgi:DNA-binding XRE family transcriptional regulator